jgi:hypothetical protein
VSTASIHVGTRPERVAWQPVLGLAMIEARRYAMRVSIWIGWAVTVAEASLNHPDWPGGSYENVLPLAFGPMLLGVFIAAVRTGARDADPDLPPLAEEAAVDVDDRHAARLLGLAMPAALAFLTAIGISIVSRIEGGFWMGDRPFRTDTAVHSPLELLQPPLLALLAGALGVVTGRALRRPLLAIVIGAFTWFLLFPAYWVWNSPPLNVTTPAQIMPLRVGIGRIIRLSEIPADWSISPPNEYQPEYERQLVHLPTVAFHHLYLVGLILIIAAGVARGRGRAVRLAGIAITIVGVAAQLAVSPHGWTG